MEKKKIAFEQSLKELESIAEKLEDENISLDDAITLFEKGIKLSKECNGQLKKAKQRIDIITDGCEEND